MGIAGWRLKCIALSGTRIRGTLLMSASPRTKLIAGIILIAAFAAGAWLLWRQVDERMTTGPQYRVELDDIELHPQQPPWIETDIRAEVFQQLSARGPLSLLDDALAVDVAEAFAAHRWVEQVEQVRKSHPSRVTVNVTYRRPVCLVELPDATGGRRIAVDRGAVVLPGAGTLEDRLPVLVGVRVPPAGPIGQPWGDPVVLGGAEVAAAVRPYVPLWGVTRIIPSRAPAAGVGEGIEYALLCVDGTRIIWGPAPGDAPPSEPEADRKVTRLKSFFQQRTEQGPIDIDVRRLPDGE